MGETDPREKRASQDKGSEVCRALQENWGLQEMSGLLGFLGLQDQRAPKETMEIVQLLR